MGLFNSVVARPETSEIHWADGGWRLIDFDEWMQNSDKDLGLDEKEYDAREKQRDQ